MQHFTSIRDADASPDTEWVAAECVADPAYAALDLLPDPAYLVELAPAPRAFANGAFGELIGKSPGGLSEADFLLGERVHRDDHPRVDRMWQRLADGESIARTTLRLRGRDGRYRRYGANAALRERRGGEALVVVVNLTALDGEDDGQFGDRETRDHLQLLESSHNIGLFDWRDLDSEYSYWSESLYALIGYAPGEIEPTLGNWVGRIHPNDQDAVVAEIHRATADPDVSFEREYRIRTKEGYYKWVLGKGQLFRGGKPRFVGLVIEIDDRYRTILSANHVQAELEEFTYSISHDLRAPVRHIASFGSLLAAEKADLLDGEGLAYVSFINDSARRLGAMIDSLLDYTRLQSLTSGRSWTDMTALAERVVDLVRESVAGDAHYTVGPLPWIRGTPALLEQLLFNLIHNAAKFSSDRAGAEIKIYVEIREGGAPGVVVEDEGIGFDADHADRLFNMFQSIHARGEVPAYDPADLGVGLATCRRIVRLHGGTIWAEGEVNKGAKFGFCIPETRL